MRQQRILRLPSERKLDLKENTESPFNYDFTATGDSHPSGTFCIVYGDWLSDEAMKLPQLSIRMETNHPTLKDKALEFFKWKNKWTQEQKQLLKLTISSNMSALRTSFLVANCIDKVKKLFTLGEELTLHAVKDMCNNF